MQYTNVCNTSLVARKTSTHNRQYGPSPTAVSVFQFIIFVDRDQNIDFNLILLAQANKSNLEAFCTDKYALIV